MNTEVLGVIASFVITLLLAIPLGQYIAKVYSGEKSLLDFMAPAERFIFRICGIDPAKQMNWKQHMLALLSINLIWLVYAFVMFQIQAKLPLNPDGNLSMTSDLSFNTAISFLVNCNLQDYSGETGVTYLTQLIVLTFLHFVSAATGIAALVVVFNAMRDKVTDKLGNFFDIFCKNHHTHFSTNCLCHSASACFQRNPRKLQRKRPTHYHAGRHRAYFTRTRSRHDRDQTPWDKRRGLVWCQLRPPT